LKHNSQHFSSVIIKTIFATLQKVVPDEDELYKHTSLKNVSIKMFSVVIAKSGGMQGASEIV